MSLFGAIGGIVGGLAKRGVIRGTVGKIFGGARPRQMTLPVGRAGLPAVIRRQGPMVARKVGRAIPGIAGGVAAGLALDQFGQPKKKRRRRINPCNDKALKRAIRRVEMYDRQRKKVDQALRKACPPARRRAAPSRRTGAHKH